MQFTVNVSRRRHLQLRRRMIHHPACRYALLGRFRYAASADEAARLIGRADLDGRTSLCSKCNPIALIAWIADAT